MCLTGQPCKGWRKNIDVKVRDENGNIVEKDVTTGFSDGVNVEITEGLSQGVTVLH